MTHRLLLILLIPIAFCGCKRQPAPNVFVDPALATLVPPGTIFTGGVRVQQLQSTPIYQRYVMQGKFPIVEQFAKETGIDPRKNLWEIVIAYDGKTSWVMLRGKFTEMGMEPRVNREGAQRLGYKGYTMLGDERMAVLFLNPTTAVAASAPALRQIIDNRDKTTGMPGWLQEKIKSIPSTNQVWFAGNLAGRDLGKFGIIAQFIESAGMATGGIDLRFGVNAHIAAETKSDDDARRLKDAVREAAGLERLKIPENRRELLRLYDGVQVQNDRSNVDIRVEIPADLLDEFVRLYLLAAGIASPRFIDPPPSLT